MSDERAETTETPGGLNPAHSHEQNETERMEGKRARAASGHGPPETPGGKRLALLSLTALGVVYGDIGTSPLYALRECFRGGDRLPVTPANVLGVLSLIFWSLIVVISLKYLTYVMRADNRGEGGILAMLALLDPWGARGSKTRPVLVAMGVFGAALLYGDGAITPAISVLSAVEGLAVAAPSTEHYVVPIAMVILVLLFVFQKRGSSGVGRVFGPVMLLWFATLAVLGVSGLSRAPEVLAAVDPRHAISFFALNRGAGFLTLGAIFLVVTGGEALYADMGHFGRRPIRLAWFGLVLPALLLDYFGQGALLLHSPEAVAQPFYRLAPEWALWPLVVLATAATVIASQAVISGAFSLTRQAVQLSELPRLRIVQTSSEEIGQIYIPSVNWLLMLATLALVVGFGSSSGLAAAYGVAITTTMVITTLLAYHVARERWGWSTAAALAVTAPFLVVDLAFFGANVPKVPEGGWFPLAAAGAVFLMMSTWRRGRVILSSRLAELSTPLDDLIEEIETDPPYRVEGTAVFMTGRREGTPPMLLHHLEHNKVLHETAVILTVTTEEVPRVPPSERLEVEELSAGFWRVLVHYGFMESPDLPRALSGSGRLGLDLDPDTTTFYLGRETLLPTPDFGMAVWRERLFAFMARNAARATAFFRIPPGRVVELGMQVEI